jgi:hypothetical protein
VASFFFICSLPLTRLMLSLGCVRQLRHDELTIAQIAAVSTTWEELEVGGLQRPAMYAALSAYVGTC